MAYTRQGDTYTLGTSKQNLIPYNNRQPSPNRNTFTAESDWNQPYGNNTQKRSPNRNPQIDERHFNSSNSNQQQRSPNRIMFIDGPNATPPTTTDQYHHTETLWRVIIDIISLGICNKKKILL